MAEVGRAGRGRGAMQALVNRIVRQKRVLEVLEDAQKKGSARDEDQEEGDLARFPSERSAASDASSTAREDVKKFKVVIGWKDNPKGRKKILVIGVSTKSITAPRHCSPRSQQENIASARHFRLAC